MRFAVLCTFVALLAGCFAAADAPRIKSPLARIEILPPDVAADVPVVVAIHGLGDRPDRFMHALDGLGAPVRTVFPAGPLRRGEGFAWWTASVRDGDPAAVVAGLREATAQVALLLEELVARHPSVGKPVVTGFSQGGMLSFALAVSRPDLVRGAVPMAGWLPEPLWPSAGPPAGAGSGPPIRAVHGADDDVLPLAPTQAAVDALRARGWDASLQVYPGVRHSLSPAMREAVYGEIRKMLAAGG